MAGKNTVQKVEEIVAPFASRALCQYLGYYLYEKRGRTGI